MCKNNPFVNSREERLRTWVRVVIGTAMFLCPLIVGFFFDTSNSAMFLLNRVITLTIAMAMLRCFLMPVFDRREPELFGQSYFYGKTPLNTGLFWADLLFGMLLSLVTFSCVFLVLIGSDQLSVAGYSIGDRENADAGLSAFFMFLASIPHAIYEEVCFGRSYLIKNMSEGLTNWQWRCNSDNEDPNKDPKALTRKTALIWSVIVGMLVFAALHASNSNFSAMAFLGLLCAGLLLAIPSIFTGSLAISLGIHHMANWTTGNGSMWGTAVSGRNPRASLIALTNGTNSQDIWTGGSFGPRRLLQQFSFYSSSQSLL